MLQNDAQKFTILKERIKEDAKNNIVTKIVPSESNFAAMKF